MHRLEKTDKLNKRQDRYDKKILKKTEKIKRKFRYRWKSICASWKNKKKSAPGKSYKQSVQNISYFNKETVYTIRKKQINDNIRYYWVENSLSDLKNHFQRSELFAIKSNFL